MTGGAVKWFKAEKGFGLTGQEGDGPEVFPHCSNISAGGFREPIGGQKAEVAAAQGRKGPQAGSVRPP